MLMMPGLFDDLFDDFARPVIRKVPAPAPQFMKTDVKESDDGYTLDIDLPGYKKENLQLELKEGYLTVTATTSNENDKEESGHFIRRERYIGTSSRSFYVGEVVTEQDINAKFENGVLSVFVPKKEAQPEIPESKYIAIA